MHIIKKSTLFLIVISILSLSSCSMTPDAADSFSKTAKAYEKAIRWGDFNYARALQLKPDKISDSKRRRLKGVRVTSYKTISRNMAPDFSQVELLVDIRYYIDTSAVERVISDLQKWVYNKKNAVWKLETSFPDFKFH